MKNFSHLVLLALLSLSFSSCLKDMDNFSYHQSEASNFDFKTTADVDIKLSYKNTGYPVKVYFELYSEDPLEYSENGISVTKKEGLSPFFCGYTDKNGDFNETLTIPSYINKVYVYSPAFFAKTLIEADVVSGKVTANDNQASTSSLSTAKFSSRAVGDNTAVSQDGWNTFLGGWDTNGYINYAIDPNNSTMTLSVNQAAALLLAHQDSINVGKTCPVSLRTKNDLTLTKNAQVVITFLGGCTCWSSSVGYYYYKGEAPKSYDEIKNKVIMIFPNTQDGHWNQKDSGVGTKGIERRTAVQLFYYGDDLNQGANPEFPKGMHIGFVLRSHTCEDNAMGCSAGGIRNHKFSHHLPLAAV